jgi:CobQ/CobB/MinD/ParA nucleotide binding domain.
MPLVISVTNAGGGLGKTTVAMLLARYFYNNGEKTLLIDTDVSQANAIQWSLKGENFDSGKVYLSDIGYDIIWISEQNEMQYIPADNYSIIIIDGRPSDYVCMYLSVYSDYIIVPFMRRKGDIYKTKEFVADIKSKGIQDKKIVYFYNREARQLRIGDIFSAPDWYLNKLAEMALGVKNEKVRI